jgi:hypothetical protein
LYLIPACFVSTALVLISIITDVHRGVKEVPYDRFYPALEWL